MSGVTTPVSTLGAAALAYASRGIKVFPLWWVNGRACACKDAADCGSPGKHPRLGPGGVHKASADEATVARWWELWPDANVGMPAGDNGLAVIDVDPAHGGDDVLAGLITHCAEHDVDLMATRIVRTGAGGLHVMFRAPRGGIKSAAKAFGPRGVDTRGRGGYIVAPPSLHASGQRYELMSTGHGLAPWPACLSTLLDAERHVATPAPDGLGPAPTAGMAVPVGDVPVDVGRRWAAAGLARECEELIGMTRPDSGRNDRLNASAYKMGRRVGAGLLDEAHAFDCLVAAASRWQGHTAREIEATVRSGLRAGKARPHAGPAPRGQA